MSVTLSAEFSDRPTMRVLQIAIPKPLHGTFDYLPPVDCDDQRIRDIQPGTRVLVPFRGRDTVGVVIGLAPQSEIASNKLKRAIRLLDTQSLVTAPLIDLCSWSAHYYGYALGEVISLCFPPALRRGGELKQRPTALTVTKLGANHPSEGLSRSPKQAALLELLQQQTQFLDDLKSLGFTNTVIKGLINKQLAQTCVLHPNDNAAKNTSETNQPQLNPEQSQALAAMAATTGFSAKVLYGITGSGKTEVYLGCIEQVLQRSQNALVLVPEIALTPQTAARFRARFGNTVGLLHSGLTDSERTRIWNHARTGALQVLLGTRSALFTPIANLGLIIVDEEHDAAFKQQDGFRYHARDLAIKRAQIEDCPIVLGSATPSLETLYNVQKGRFDLLKLTQRATQAALPHWQILDVRRSQLTAGLSQPLIEACRETLAKGEQVLLFLNRRGFAHTLLCHDCGWIAECDRCDSRLVIHQRNQRLRCHHCQAQKPMPSHCPNCRSQHWQGVGVGTERAELALETLFPNTPITRIDSDSIGSVDQLNAALDSTRVESGGAIIIGTQMLAKGHDLEKVTLVGIVDTDALLFSADFRAEERLAQLLIQVSGRSGRGDKPGRAILQTHHPEAPLFQQILNNDFLITAHDLLQHRIESGLPPIGQMMLIHCDSPTPSDAEAFLMTCRQRAQRELPSDLQFIGPIPAPLSRRAGKFRYQLTVFSAHQKNLHQWVAHLIDILNTIRSKNHLSFAVDVDPYDFL